MTEKLYDKDSHIREFSANVIKCGQCGEKYAVVLDKTAFFPEGGGQFSDKGFIADSEVFDVQEKDGEIVHYTNLPVQVGASVKCTLDWKRRFRCMQNHTGEHIIVGLIHNMYGFNNVGFHLGEDDVTFDVDGELTRKQLDEIEYLANEAVAKNVAVTAEYPSPEELQKMTYRSKLKLTENVRIVTVDGYDKCACCAPHVSRTGEIGMIKILDFMRYKGGIRAHIACGFDALSDYNRKYRSIQKIAASLSSKQDEASEAFDRLYTEYENQKHEIVSLKTDIFKLKSERIGNTIGNLCLFEDKSDSAALRNYANMLVSKCSGVCAIFSGSDKDGYNYVMASKNVNLRENAKKINAALNGKGGGSADMLQGSAMCEKLKIQQYFDTNEVWK